jgi:hypothetical protein
MGIGKRPWQDTDYVLGFFGKTAGAARSSYSAFVTKAVTQGHRPELVGGGLLRSVGGWLALEGYRRRGVRIKGDERILGSSDFVERVLAKADEDLAHKSRLQAEGPDLHTLIERVTHYYHIDSEDLKTASKQRQTSRARMMVCYLAVRKLMVHCTEVARALNISPSAVSKAANRAKMDSSRRKIQKALLGI